MAISKLAEWFIPADLQAIFDESGHTQVQVGKALGVGPRTIYNYMNGESLPKLAMAAKFCEYCGANEKRTEFLVHVINQFAAGQIVSELDQRNIFIIERAEATYGEFWEWEPWYIPGVLQKERYHFEMLPEQGQNPLQNWQRKHRRYLRTFNRRPGPTMKFLISANAMRQLDGWAWRDDQIQHLLELDERPNCEIRVLEGLHHGVEHAFTNFFPAGRPNAGPSFVYVETIDQSRHIENSQRIDLYHGQVKGMWSFAKPIGRYLDE